MTVSVPSPVFARGDSKALPKHPLKSTSVPKTSTFSNFPDIHRCLLKQLTGSAHFQLKDPLLWRRAKKRAKKPDEMGSRDRCFSGELVRIRILEEVAFQEVAGFLQSQKRVDPLVHGATGQRVDSIQRLANDIGCRLRKIIGTYMNGGWKNHAVARYRLAQ